MIPLQRWKLDKFLTRYRYFFFLWRPYQNSIEQQWILFLWWSQLWSGKKLCFLKTQLSKDYLRSHALPSSLAPLFRFESASLFCKKSKPRTLVETQLDMFQKDFPKLIPSKKYKKTCFWRTARLRKYSLFLREGWLKVLTFVWLGLMTQIRSGIEKREHCRLTIENNCWQIVRRLQ